MNTNKVFKKIESTEELNPHLKNRVMDSVTLLKTMMLIADHFTINFGNSAVEIFKNSPSDISGDDFDNKQKKPK